MPGLYYMDFSLIVFLIGVVWITLFVIGTRNSPMSGVVLVPPFLMVVFGGVIQLSAVVEDLVDKFIPEETKEMLAGYFLIIMGVWAIYLVLASTVKKIIVNVKKG